MEAYREIATDYSFKKTILDQSGNELICVFLGSFLMLGHSLPLVYKLALETSHPTVVLESFGFAVEYLRTLCPWQYLFHVTEAYHRVVPPQKSLVHKVNQNHTYNHSSNPHEFGS